LVGVGTRSVRAPRKSAAPCVSLFEGRCLDSRTVGTLACRSRRRSAAPGLRCRRVAPHASGPASEGSAIIGHLGQGLMLLPEVVIEVRPAFPEDFQRVWPLLLELSNGIMSQDDWRRMLFDLPWKAPEAQRGYMLLDGREAVGYFGVIFSNRTLAGQNRR